MMEGGTHMKILTGILLLFVLLAACSCAAGGRYPESGPYYHGNPGYPDYYFYNLPEGF